MLSRRSTMPWCGRRPNAARCSGVKYSETQRTRIIQPSRCEEMGAPSFGSRGTHSLHRYGARANIVAYLPRRAHEVCPSTITDTVGEVTATPDSRYIRGTLVPRILGRRGRIRVRQQYGRCRGVNAGGVRSRSIQPALKAVTVRRRAALVPIPTRGRAPGLIRAAARPLYLNACIPNSFKQVWVLKTFPRHMATL
jgi:hypothetical protein